jgi:hypothetical protein
MNPDEFENINKDLADSIADELKNQSIEQKPVEVTSVTDENINDYIYKKSTELVESSLAAIQTIRDTVIQGINPDEINALSTLINATNKALDTLNKINLQNKKDKTSEKIKNLELAARKEMMAKRIPATTNILVATREEIMKTLNPGKKGQVEQIDIE